MHGLQQPEVAGQQFAGGRTVLTQSGDCMFEDDIEDEELNGEESADLDMDDVEAEAEFSAAGDAAMDVDEPDATEDEGEAPVRGKTKSVAVEEELPSVEAKRKERDALAEAMAAFLARGGKIQSVEASGD